jgi:hypothetical protein
VGSTDVQLAVSRLAVDDQSALVEQTDSLRPVVCNKLAEPKKVLGRIRTLALGSRVLNPNHSAKAVVICIWKSRVQIKGQRLAGGQTGRDGASTASRLAVALSWSGGGRLSTADWRSTGQQSTGGNGGPVDWQPRYSRSTIN